MKATDLRAKSVDELNAELIELRRAQFSLRMQIATQQLTKVDQLGKVRKDVARPHQVALMYWRMRHGGHRHLPPLALFQVVVQRILRRVLVQY